MLMHCRSYQTGQVPFKRHATFLFGDINSLISCGAVCPRRRLLESKPAALMEYSVDRYLTGLLEPVHHWISILYKVNMAQKMIVCIGMTNSLFFL